MKPEMLQIEASAILLALGGVVATTLLSAFVHLAPVFGFPFIDVPRLVGGVFSADFAVAFWVGFALFFATGAIVFPMLFLWARGALPGAGRGLRPALIKGSVFGLILFLVGGVLLPAFGALNRLVELENPGFFGLAAGWMGMLGLLGGHLVYGVAVALIGSIGYGAKPLDLLGWRTHWPADLPGISAVGPIRPDKFGRSRQ